MSSSVAVIGGSIAGLYAAERLARRGHTVRVYDGADGLDPTCRSLIVTGALRDLLGDWAEDAIVNEIDRFELVANDKRVEVELGSPDLIIERATLIRRLAAAAEASGAEIAWGHRLERMKAHGNGIDMRFRNNGTEPTMAGSVIGADGAFSNVARAAGWRPQRLVSLVQALVRLPSDLPPKTVRVWFVPQDTPYFYWLIPESETTGALGVIGAESSVTRALIDQFAAQQNLDVLGYQGAKIPEYAGWTSLHRRMGHGDVYLTGDAAGHVKVTTVGGVVDGLWGARAVADAIASGRRRCTASSLRAELGMHWLIRVVLNRFGDADYRALLENVAGTSSGSLARYSRDEATKLMWDLIRRRPRFVFLAARALFAQRT
ncbi:MAG TPA: FAD-dependent monooxygenase [Acidobacteriota bacterium]|nr:FAD-dependent monooxygenase [Acidobacteriota bacterium]